MKKNCRVLFILFFLFISIKSYAIELTNEFMYGTWETKISLNNEQCSTLLGQGEVTFQIFCNIKDITVYNRNNIATSDGKINIKIVENNQVIVDETMRYTATTKWTIFPESNEILETLNDSDNWFISSPNEKVPVLREFTITRKVIIIDQNTIETSDIGYGLKGVSKRIL
ncbi:hypothetical protein RHO13_00070 [Orbus wheelerorum]|uniref:hypothetical protein n=1 Tax=Orbus wheelerorum TaxID=3074111 RepID=UPI00370D37C0